MKNSIYFKQRIFLRTAFLIRIFLGMALLIPLNSCEDFLDIDSPSTQIVAESVFSNEESAESVIRGIYSSMHSGFAAGGFGGFTAIGGLSADELIDIEGFDVGFTNNTLLPSNARLSGGFWENPYKIIYNANAIIEGLHDATDFSEELKKTLTGEAKFIRAFYHFYLLNFFGDVPIVTSTNVEENRMRERNPVQLVYEQIQQDLLDAHDLLPAGYSGERIRPNKATAAALLARVYLYLENWAEAETWSSSVINNTDYELLTDLNAVFLENSREAIWQLKPTWPQGGTSEASVFVRHGNPGYDITDDLLNAFEEADLRKDKWIGEVASDFDPDIIFHFPFKYKIISEPGEYSVIFRLAEQYLIRAEARLQQGNSTGALADLNKIRERAGLVELTTIDMAAIAQERRVEFFAEWGHRWLDLKRTNRADEVLSSFMTKDWQSTDVLYPIPESEMEVNNNMTQNPGY